jgi:hypothetical protein
LALAPNETNPLRRGGPLCPPARYDNLARLTFLLLDVDPLITPPRIVLLPWFELGELNQMPLLVVDPM